MNTQNKPHATPGLALTNRLYSCRNNGTEKNIYIRKPPAVMKINKCKVVIKTSSFVQGMRQEENAFK